MPASPFYAELIRGILAELGHPEIPPAVVEGWMRCEYGTLDHLPRERFVKEARDVVAMWSNPRNREHLTKLAESYGLA